MLTPKSLQNKSNWDNDKPSIVITPDQPQWQEAYSRWLDGKNPTDSPEWKKGVYLTFNNMG